MIWPFSLIPSLMVCTLAAPSSTVCVCVCVCVCVWLAGLGVGVFSLHRSPTHLQMIPANHLMQSECPDGFPSFHSPDHTVRPCHYYTSASLFTCLSALPETCMTLISLITACHAGLCIRPCLKASFLFSASHLPITQRGGPPAHHRAQWSRTPNATTTPETSSARSVHSHLRKNYSRLSLLYRLWSPWWKPWQMAS